MKIYKFYTSVSVFLIGFSLQIKAQEPLTYQKPPEEIMELLEAPTTPEISINNSGSIMLLLNRPDYPSIEEVAQPILRIGGLRINPANNSSVNATRYSGIKIKFIKTGKEASISGLPSSPRIDDVAWSPDEKFIAFTNSTAEKVELWVIDMQNYSARKMSNLAVNDAFGMPYQWAPDSKSLLVKFIPDDRGAKPQESTVPPGPVVQENLGKAAAARTYQDLLKNPYDEKLFDFYLTSQLKKIAIDGVSTNISSPAIYRRFDYSPDGNYILSQTIIKPYSYLVPAMMFPYNVRILDSKGDIVKDVYTAPLADNRPRGFDAVDKGPRGHSWRNDQDAVLYWAEAQDGGDPSKSVPVRDVVYTLRAPFSSAPSKLAECSYRFSGIDWGNENMAVVSERWWKTRKEKQTLIDPSKGSVIKVISDRFYEQTYTDPGNFVITKNAAKRNVLLVDSHNGQSSVFTISVGASPAGDRPFLMKWNLISGKTDTLFRSKAPWYELPVFFNNNGTLVISRESVDQSPDYYLVNLKSRSLKAITRFADPYPSLKGITKQQLAYKRRDGINMTGTLYLPRGYKKADGPLPMLMWAYPREFKTVDAASQVKGSPYRFTRITWGSPIYWVTRGYAVLDNADMPIVGEGKNEPNDTFVQQLQDNAKAAIDYVVGLGVADRHRIAVGGHSYGAFMTANLLAHTNFFAAGIARSGAYNRTLTPFGFQQEERTYWQAPEVYYKMSPFSYADKIKTPLLLIHGEADDNSGTFPIQSERLYNALKGHGAITRLVFLPNEAHHYYAKESVMHMLWEMDQWLDKYVKKNKVASE